MIKQARAKGKSMINIRQLTENEIARYLGDPWFQMKTEYRDGKPVHLEFSTEDCNVVASIHRVEKSTSQPWRVTTWINREESTILVGTRRQAFIHAASMVDCQSRE